MLIILENLHSSHLFASGRVAHAVIFEKRRFVRTRSANDLRTVCVVSLILCFSGIVLRMPLCCPKQYFQRAAAIV